MTQREYTRLVFGDTWTTRIQTTIGILVAFTMILMSLNPELAHLGDPFWQ